MVRSMERVARGVRPAFVTWNSRMAISVVRREREAVQLSSVLMVREEVRVEVGAWAVQCSPHSSSFSR